MTTRRLGWIVGTLLLVPQALHAQTLQQIAIPNQLEFPNPGTRSLAVGGSFVGLADDPTAALVNPAGLPQVRRPEVFIEGRYQRFVWRLLNGGRVSGSKTGLGIDTADGPVYASTTDSHMGPSYAAFVYPRGRWALAVYRHELVRMSASVASEGVLANFGGPSVLPGVAPGDLRQFAWQGSREIAITTYGLSGAFRIGSALSLGAGVVVQHLALDAKFRGAVSTIYGPADFTRTIGGSQPLQRASETSGAPVFGVQWTALPNVRVGAVFRRAPSFAFEQRRGPGLAFGNGVFRFKTPDRFAVGVAAQLTDGLLFTAEYDRVQYSQLTRGYVRAQTPSGTEDFLIRDGNELHTGFEYVFRRMRTRPALRWGAWYDPRHSVQYAGTSGEGRFNALFSAYTPTVPNRTHLTFGAGMELTSQLELHMAGDLASKFRIFSTSAIVRF